MDASVAPNAQEESGMGRRRCVRYGPEFATRLVQTTENAREEIARHLAAGGETQLYGFVQPLLIERCGAQTRAVEANG